MNTIESKVLGILSAATNKVSLPNSGNGWVNLADLGALLRNNGIDYNSYGYEKLKSFIDSFNSMETYRDERNVMPVIYVRERISLPTSNALKTKTTKESLTIKDPGTALTDWAFLGYFPATMKKLKDMALEENWGKIRNADGKYEYPRYASGDECYPILVNYIQYTFYKLKVDNQVYENNEYAAFNTGLVDVRYKPIYALFAKNRDKDKPQQWYFKEFCIEGEEWSGKTLAGNFSPLPPRANYFNNISDLLFDYEKGFPSLDYKHIIIENIERLPFDFIKANAPQGFDIQDPRCLTGDKRSEYFESLKSAILTDSWTYRKITNRFKEAVETSMERVKWNFKSAIPMYYAKRREMCFFLPICLIEDNKVDVALVLSNKKVGGYQGETIYKLDWAYKCARLVCRPDSDWLNEASTEYQSVDDI